MNAKTLESLLRALPAEDLNALTTIIQGMVPEATPEQRAAANAALETWKARYN